MSLWPSKCCTVTMSEPFSRSGGNTYGGIVKCGVFDSVLGGDNLEPPKEMRHRPPLAFGKTHWDVGKFLEETYEVGGKGNNAFLVVFGRKTFGSLRGDRHGSFGEIHIMPS